MVAVIPSLLCAGRAGRRSRAALSFSARAAGHGQILSHFLLGFLSAIAHQIVGDGAVDKAKGDHYHSHAQYTKSLADHYNLLEGQLLSWKATAKPAKTGKLKNDRGSMTNQLQ